MLQETVGLRDKTSPHDNFNYYLRMKNIYNLLLKHLVLPILRVAKNFINWTIDYTGPLAELVKTIPILLMFAFVLFPIWSYPFWLWAGQTLGPPGNYIIYALWLLLFFGSSILAAIIGYARESR